MPLLIISLSRVEAQRAGLGAFAALELAGLFR
jgi:hypothetical protein